MLSTDFSILFQFLVFDKQRAYTSKSSKCRSSFSVEQVLQLERVFEGQKYLGSRDRQRIAEQLQMTETQVITVHLLGCLSLTRRFTGVCFVA